MTTIVPPALASAVEGCWDLAPRYRITLRRVTQGLTIQQETINRLGKPVKRLDEVRYNPQDKTLSFTGIGDIHRVLVTMRWTNGGVLEVAFSSEIAPGKWQNGTWEPAARCTATASNGSHGRATGEPTA